MRSQKTFLPSLSVMALCSVLIAEEPPELSGPMQLQQEQHPFLQRRLDVLLKGVSLTPAQRAGVDSVVARYVSQVRAITPSAEPDSAGREQLRPVLERMDREIRGVLTPEQQQVWDGNRAALRRQGPPGDEG